MPWAVSAVILLPFQWESSSLIYLNMKGIPELFFFLTSIFSIPDSLCYRICPIVFPLTKTCFPWCSCWSLKFHFVFSPYPFQCFLQPLLLSRFMVSCFPGIWAQAILISSFSSRFSFSLLLVAIPQAFSWTPNEKAAMKNLHVPDKLCSVCSEGMVKITWVHPCLHWKPEILKRDLRVSAAQKL